MQYYLFENLFLLFRDILTFKNAENTNCMYKIIN